MKQSMNIVPIKSLKDNYIWVIIDTHDHSALIVDPGEAKPVMDFLEQEQLQLKGILATHHHWDHTNGISALIKRYSVPLFAPAKENIPQTSVAVSDNDVITIDSFSFQVMEIPGHTLGHVAYYTPELIFCGDTLFAAGCGKLFEGTMHELYSSLQKIATLPASTKIFCAHEYTLNNLNFAKLVEPTNENIAKRMEYVTKLRQQNLPTLPSELAEEKQTNPFLRCEVKEIIDRASEKAGKQLDTPIEVFTVLRKWKDGYTPPPLPDPPHQAKNA